jgi:riboflavin kinase/FMN adenylyltransferase
VVKVHERARDFRADRPIVLTVGTFDGVHAGHRAVLAALGRKAHELGAETCLLTFSPHPRTVLHPDSHGLQVLNSADEKRDLLEAAGLHHLVVEPFTLDLARMSPEDYVEALFVQGIRPACVVVGYDHRFGRGRSGDFHELARLGALHGFAVEELAAASVDEVRVSSTKVREALAGGDVATAATWLTAPYPFTGTVVHGAGRGSGLGFPTANVQPEDPLKLVPADGVYAAWAALAGERPVPAMVNVGTRPTFTAADGDGPAPERTVEAHALEPLRSCYGEQMRLFFVERLRDEQRFADAAALQAQLAADRHESLDLLARTGGVERTLRLA